jgi:hypothetical protein
MHRYIGIIAAIFAVLGFLSTAMMFWAHANNGGMAVMAFHLWGVIASVAAVALGFLARFMAKRVPTPISRASDFGMGLGLGVLLAQLIGFLILG